MRNKFYSHYIINAVVSNAIEVAFYEVTFYQEARGAVETAVIKEHIYFNNVLFWIPLVL